MEGLQTPLFAGSTIVLTAILRDLLRAFSSGGGNACRGTRRIAGGRPEWTDGPVAAWPIDRVYRLRESPVSGFRRGGN